MIVLLIAALGVALSAIGLWLRHDVDTLRRDVNVLTDRLAAAEALITELKIGQDGMAQEWASIFANQQSAWDRHVDKVAQAVTLELALGSTQRRNRR